MPDFSGFFRKNMGKLQQAGLYRPCPNPTFDNPSFDKAGFRVLIVRLSPFRDVDRSIPHLFLAGAVRRAVPDAYVDMCFLPPVRDRKLLEKNGIPFLAGTQSFHSTEDFNLVLVSNSYTLELINLPFLLLRSGMPIEAGLRDEKWPPVILGGSNAMAAQAMIREDGESIADAVFFGEGEREVEKLVLCLKDNGDGDKRDRLQSAATMVAGLWVAGRRSGPADVVRKSVVTDLRVDDLIVRSPVLNSPEAGTAHLQITQGCPAFCAF